MRFLYLALFYSASSLAETKTPQFIEPVNLNSSLTMFWGLLVVLAFIFILLFVLKKMGFSGYQANGPLKVLHGVQVGQKEKIVLIEVGEEQLLVGVTPGEITKLHKLKTPVKIAQPQNNTKPDFKQMISTVLDKK